jgi:hypothetical protein
MLLEEVAMKTVSSIYLQLMQARIPPSNPCVVTPHGPCMGFTGVHLRSLAHNMHIYDDTKAGVACN